MHKDLCEHLLIFALEFGGATHNAVVCGQVVAHVHFVKVAVVGRHFAHVFVPFTIVVVVSAHTFVAARRKAKYG